MSVTRHLCLFLLLLPSAAATPGGTIDGVITILDPNEEPVPLSGAEVTLYGPLGKTYDTTSGLGGVYSFTGLPAGDYTLTAHDPVSGLTDDCDHALEITGPGDEDSCDVLIDP